jgi:hypothetical protein
VVDWWSNTSKCNTTLGGSEMVPLDIFERIDIIILMVLRGEL